MQALFPSKVTLKLKITLKLSAVHNLLLITSFSTKWIQIKTIILDYILLYEMDTDEDDYPIVDYILLYEMDTDEDYFKNCLVRCFFSKMISSVFRVF